MIQTVVVQTPNSSESVNRIGARAVPRNPIRLFDKFFPNVHFFYEIPDRFKAKADFEKIERTKFISVPYYSLFRNDTIEFSVNLNELIIEHLSAHIFLPRNLTKN